MGLLPKCVSAYLQEDGCVLNAVSFLHVSAKDLPSNHLPN